MCSPPAHENYHGMCPACSHTCTGKSGSSIWPHISWGSSFHGSQSWAMRLLTSSSTYQGLVCSPCLFPLSAWWGLCQGLPSEAVSSPSFAGSPGMLLSSTKSTQAVRTSRRPVVQYFIQEEIYTHLSLAGGAASSGHGCNNTATAVFVQRKEPRSPGECSEPGV